jgi:predicted dehydrogenase
MKLSVIGLGYWGPNLLRNANNLGVLHSAVDLDEEKLLKFVNDPIYKEVIFSTDYKDILEDKNVDGVIISTPPNTHYKIAIDALNSGKNVFLEKPMTLDVQEAKEILILADKLGLVLSVGHIFLYSPEIIKLKEIINSPDFGKIHYAYIQRLNLGKIQSPANVIEDLSPHDISIIDYLFDSECESVSAFGTNHVIDTEDVAFINMKYKNGTTAHLHLSWLDPLKIRKTVVVGSKQMVVCESGEKKIEIYNMGIDVKERSETSNLSYADHLMSYRYGDIVVPYIKNKEPMRDELLDFINSIKNNTQPIASGHIGFNVVKVLSAMQTSLKNSGAWIEVD